MNMATKNISVILVMILVVCISAGKTQQQDNKTSDSVPTTTTSTTTTVNATGQTDNTTSQTDNTTSQTDNTASQTDNTASQTDNPTTTAVPILQTTGKSGGITKVRCVLINFDWNFNLTFKNDDQTTLSKQYNITTSKGEITRLCDSQNQSLTVWWGKYPSSITFNFTRVEDNKYMLSQVYIFIDVSEEFLNKTAAADQIVNLTYTSKDDFKTPIGKSYNCSNGKTLRFVNSTDSTKDVKVTVLKMHFEAFHNGDDETFSPSEDCSSNNGYVDSGVRVVIIVVCCLVVALTLALLAFFILRRRAQGHKCNFNIFSACARTT